MPSVLVVEDDKLFRWALKDALERAGYDVIEAENCAEARNNLHNGVDAALLDYHLPDGTGLGLLDEIKRENLRFPAILLTAHPTDESAEQAEALGAYHYATKPDDGEKVLPWLEAALSGREISE